jgi:ABC-type transport system involved in cytochrome bd biosynthesis fused ATPase/permease subunit
VNFATPFSLLITFVAYGLSHTTLDTRSTFTIVGFINLLTGPFQSTGVAANVLSALLPSLSRIGAFFQSPTLPNYVESTLADESMPSHVAVIDGVFKWPKSKAETDTLSQINFRVNAGEKLVIIGKVGSGKTSILEALMGNIPKKEGTVRMVGTVAYMPQTAWIYNATIRYAYILFLFLVSWFPSFSFLLLFFFLFFVYLSLLLLLLCLFPISFLPFFIVLFFPSFYSSPHH